jgi:hypothetical protein
MTLPVESNRIPDKFHIFRTKLDDHASILGRSFQGPQGGALEGLQLRSRLVHPAKVFCSGRAFGWRLLSGAAAPAGFLPELLDAEGYVASPTSISCALRMSPSAED